MLRKKKTTYVTILGLVGVLMQSGCGPKRPETVGFLSDYSHLEPVSETSSKYTNTEYDLGDYSNFILDPVVVRFHGGTEEPELSRKELAELRQHMFAEVHNAILNDYNIVRRPGPGVARIRIAITDVGPGGASMEAEVLDSQTGEQMGAIIESQKGKMFSLEGLSKWGDTKAVMRRWARRFKECIDEAHRY